MDYRDRAIQALRRAEADLRGIIADALAANAYADLANLANMAESVSGMIAEFSSGLLVPRLSRAALTDGPSHNQEEPSPKSGRLVKGRGRDSFPKFQREGDKLLKIAWSKKERRPYEHRAPQAVIQTLIDAIRKRKGEGKLFEANDILPLLSATGEEYPSYQSYLALSWLRHVGVVTKKGREGYVLKPKAANSENIHRLWVSLPNND